MDLKELKKPFFSSDVEWRIGRAGKGDKGTWAMCLAYITNRAIMERLDEVCGPENWKNEYREGPGGGVLCGLSIRTGDEWVTKWDGADNTDMEAVKGGLSGAMKRAAVQWGIGRYLYKLPEGWANIHSDGQYYGKTKDGERFRWDPPGLPGWARPGGDGKPASDSDDVNRETGEIREDTEPADYQPPAQSPDVPTNGVGGHECPKCGGPVWDNRDDKPSPNYPDYKCKDREGCDWAFWVESATKELDSALTDLVRAGKITEAAKANCLEGVEDGDLDAFRIAQDWVNNKEA